MTTMLRSGVQWLRDRLDEATAEAIVYQSGSRRWNLTATPMTSEGQQVITEGIGTTFYEIHWVVSVAQLDDYGIRPRPGDVIWFGGAGFEVFSRDSQPCVTPHDQLGVLIRIHTELARVPHDATRPAGAAGAA